VLKKATLLVNASKSTLSLANVNLGSGFCSLPWVIFSYPCLSFSK
jgi:hypothetical protein